MSQRKSKTRVATHESYLFQITEVSPHYGFHLAHAPHETGAYGEYLHTELKAKCLKPSKYEGRETTFTFIGDRGITDELKAPGRTQRSPLCVGTLTMRGNRSSYLGSLPFDIAVALPLIAVADGSGFIVLSGTTARGGTATIRSSSFYRDIDPDDY